MQNGTNGLTPISPELVALVLYRSRFPGQFLEFSSRSSLKGKQPLAEPAAGGWKLSLSSSQRPL